jgi:hypothetical protein
MLWNVDGAFRGRCCWYPWGVERDTEPKRDELLKYISRRIARMHKRGSLSFLHFFLGVDRYRFGVV